MFHKSIITFPIHAISVSYAYAAVSNLWPLEFLGMLRWKNVSVYMNKACQVYS